VRGALSRFMYLAEVGPQKCGLTRRSMRTSRVRGFASAADRRLAWSVSRMMTAVELPRSPIAGLATVELTAGRESILQAFFEANSAVLRSGAWWPRAAWRGPEEMYGELPAGWPFTKKW